MTAFDFTKLVDVGPLKPGLLYPYQSDGVAFLLSKKRAVLGDDMGLGKTRQAIVSMQMGAPEGKVLVVCPAALKLNWRREILLVDPDAAVEVVGSRIPAAENPRWLIINYDLLGKHALRLHDVGCERDKAGNRQLHFDHYCALILLFLLNPVLRSFRALQQGVGPTLTFRVADV